MDFLETTLRLFQYYKHLAEKAIGQISDNHLNFQPNNETNSIAIIVQHLQGNMLSRWTDFKTTDGEKPWRDRDAEFEVVILNRQSILQKWEDGWQCLFAAITSIREEELNNIIYIRNEGHTIQEALMRQVAHYGYHVGQIVLLAKMFDSEKWESLSIPRNHSKAYNAEKFQEEKSEKHFTNEWITKNN